MASSALFKNLKTDVLPTESSTKDSWAHHFDRAYTTLGTVVRPALEPMNEPAKPRPFQSKLSATTGQTRQIMLGKFVESPRGINSGKSMQTQTELANRIFMQEARLIPGVISVHGVGGKTISEQSFVVFVPTLKSKASEDVVKLRSAIWRDYPDAQLSIRIKGLKERGIDPEHVTEDELACL